MLKLNVIGLLNKCRDADFTVHVKPLSKINIILLKLNILNNDSNIKFEVATLNVTETH